MNALAAGERRPVEARAGRPGPRMRALNSVTEALHRHDRRGLLVA